MIYATYTHSKKVTCAHNASHGLRPILKRVDRQMYESEWNLSAEVNPQYKNVAKDEVSMIAANGSSTMLCNALTK